MARHSPEIAEGTPTAYSYNPIALNSSANNFVSSQEQRVKAQKQVITIENNTNKCIFHSNISNFSPLTEETTASENAPFIAMSLVSMLFSLLYFQKSILL